MAADHGLRPDILEDIQRINIKLSDEAIQDNAYGVMLLRDLDASVCVGDLSKMIRFSQAGTQRYIQWRNCKTHKTRIVEFICIDPAACFFTSAFRASFGLSLVGGPKTYLGPTNLVKQIAPNINAITADVLAAPAHQTTSPPLQSTQATTNIVVPQKSVSILGQHQTEIPDRMTATNLILEAARNGMNVNNPHAIDLINLATAIGGSATPQLLLEMGGRDQLIGSSAQSNHSYNHHPSLPLPLSLNVGSTAQSSVIQKYGTYTPRFSSSNTSRTSLPLPYHTSLLHTQMNTHTLIQQPAQMQTPQVYNYNQPNKTLYDEIKSVANDHNLNVAGPTFNLQPVPSPRIVMPIVQLDAPTSWSPSSPRPITYEQDQTRLLALRAELKSAIKTDTELLSHRYNDWLEAFPLHAGEERNPGLDMLLANQSPPCPTDATEYAIAVRYAKKRPYYFCEIKYWQDSLKYAKEDGYQWESNTTRAEREGFSLRRPYDRVDTTAACSLRGTSFTNGDWAGRVRCSFAFFDGADLGCGFFCLIRLAKLLVVKGYRDVLSTSIILSKGGLCL
ncbi:hypothetical protein P154DRAFT_531281 [Amniculicola lignicola CBS 123094]|uniref:Uncharacterized protein n=1 Tax=Amniculicola lignicola CBS 123094 TaxID=1392246 RepID=A0A6A5WSP2_9PLEO|nr:hypothetical protein P154DRAFT_531281 [Amniculicola lignicola CBS 123094]